MWKNRENRKAAALWQAAGEEGGLQYVSDRQDHR